MPYPPKLMSNSRAHAAPYQAILAVKRDPVIHRLMSDYQQVPGAESVPMAIPRTADALPVWKQVLLVFIPSLVAFVVLDVTWISLVAAAIYKAVLGEELRSPPDAVAGLLAWVFIVGGVYVFALPSSKTVVSALQRGALLGLSIYGCYEFTNLSILTRWTWSLALADTAWGSVACAVACALQLVLVRRVGGAA